MAPIYLDHAATTPLGDEARAAMLPWLGGVTGNPSSVHSMGRKARAALDEARDGVAVAIGCAAREIVFTSGGTEADNLALRGVVERWGDELGRHVVVSAVEHEAVITTAQRLAEIGAVDLSVVGCDRLGRVDPEAVAAAVRDDTVLVSVMLANNEVGTIQPVARITEAVRRRNPRTLIHTDAVQALGRLALDWPALGVDLLTLSAHKAYGPVGVGALVVRHGVFVSAQLTGGGQERGRRSGTENVAGIAGFAAALAAVEAERSTVVARLDKLVGHLTSQLGESVPGWQVTGPLEDRLPGHLSAIIPNCRSELLLARLDEAGVCASAGSACASGAPLPSHVLTAMGYGDVEAACALRLSLGRATNARHCDEAALAIAEAVSAMHSAPMPSASV